MSRHPRDERDLASREERRAEWARAAASGVRRGQRRSGGGRIWREARPEPFELATSSLEALYPFQTAPPSRDTDDDAAGGMVVGTSATGGVWRFDPWTLYTQGRLHNPNILVLGDVGSGKSSLVKTLVWRGLAHGRGAHVLDPKGEYGPLADAAGTQPIRLRPGGGVVLNPLDVGPVADRLPPVELLQRNLTTVRALAETVLARPLTQLEQVLLSATLTHVTDLDRATATGTAVRSATLPDLADTLRTPPPSVAARVNMDDARLVEESRELSLAMSRLTEPDGDLGGMFAGPSTIDPRDLDRLVVLDLADVHRHHRHVLPLVMTAAAAWLQTAVNHTGPRFQVNDEAWALLSDPAIARWMQANQKLSRQLSLSVVNVLHRLSDTAATGDHGTAVRSLAEGVIADAGTWIVYRQKPSERDLLRKTLRLNQMQADLVTRIGRGRGLWIVGGEQRRVALVDHILSRAERTIVNTDQAMSGVPVGRS